jgi:preprotein translocase subunit SecD
LTEYPVPGPGPGQGAAIDPNYGGYGYQPAPVRGSRLPVLLGLGVIVLVAILVSAAVVIVVRRDHGPATTITYRLTPPAGQTIEASWLDTTVGVLKSRLDSLGIEGTVEKTPPDQVTAKVYVADLGKLATEIAAVGKIEFILLPKAAYGDMTAPGGLPVPDGGAAIDPALPAQFNGNQLDAGGTSAASDQNSPGYWMVNFRFNASFAGDFETWTGQHVNEFFAITADRVALTVPYIKSAITGGEGNISGQFTESQAKNLVAIIKSGALPVPLTLVSVAGPPTTPSR